MSFEDFFDKSGSSSERFRPHRFTSPSLTPPAVSEPSEPRVASTFLSGLVLVILLGITEGTLLWVIFESLEDLGAIDVRLPWHPFIVIALAVNLIRVFDRSAFGRQ